MPSTSDRRLLAAHATVRRYRQGSLDRASYNRKRDAYGALCGVEARMLAGPVSQDETTQEIDRILATLTPPKGDKPDAHD